MRVKLAERFGKWPWELAEVPVDEYLELIEWLNLEGELSSKYPAKG